MNDSPIERAVDMCGSASELGRRIGATPARLSLARHGKATLTAEQSAAIDTLLAGPPPVIASPCAIDPSTTPDGVLIDRARALPGIGTLAELARRMEHGRHHLTRVRHGQSHLSEGARSALRQLLGEHVAAPTVGFVEVCVGLALGEIEAFRDIANRQRTGLRETVDAAVQGWLAEHERLQVAPGRAGLPRGAGWRVSIGTAVLVALDERLRAERGVATPNGRAGAVRQAILWAIKKSEGCE